MRISAFLLLSIFFFSSCSEKRAALYYFNKIVSYDNKVGKLRNNYDQKIERAIDGRILSGNYGRPGELREELISRMNSELIRLKKIGKLKGDGALMDAAVKFFSAIRDFYSEEKKEIIALRSRVLPPGPEEKKRIEELETQMATKSQAILNDFVVAQQSFANKYGFPLVFPDK